MIQRNSILFAAFLLAVMTATSCSQPIEFPDGVQVLIDGESIEGDKVVLVDQGASVRLQVTGLQSNSNVNFLVKKLGIKIHEEDFPIGGEGSMDEMVPLPDISVQVTAIISFTDLNGIAQEMSFIIKLR